MTDNASMLAQLGDKKKHDDACKEGSYTCCHTSSGYGECLIPTVPVTSNEAGHDPGKRDLDVVLLAAVLPVRLQRCLVMVEIQFWSRVARHLPLHRLWMNLQGSNVNLQS